MVEGGSGRNQNGSCEANPVGISNARNDRQHAASVPVLVVIARERTAEGVDSGCCHCRPIRLLRIGLACLSDVFGCGSDSKGCYRSCHPETTLEEPAESLFAEVTEPGRPH